VTGWQPDPEVPGLMRRTAENRSGAGGGHPHFVVEQNGEVRAPGFRARREDEPLQAYFESALRHGLAGQDITLDVAGQPAIEPVGRGSQWGRMQAVTEAALEELAREQAREDGLMLPESPPDDDDDDDGSGGIFGGGFFI
jgi:hypothetical protein